MSHTAVLPDYLLPLPVAFKSRRGVFRVPEKALIRVEGDAQTAPAVTQLIDDLLCFCQCEASTRGDGSADVVLAVTSGTEPEAYRLCIDDSSVHIAGSARGLFYGVQTLGQILANESRDAVPCCEIEDGPRYAERSVMLDLGRAPYSVPLLQRIVKILARLKLNTMHLHLNDDHLCGVRFETLPFGSENSAALSMRELRAFVAFARQYHITVVPEFESWGHAGSAVFHYPRLRGGPGRWEGSSFAIGRQLYSLLRRAYAELLECIPDGGIFHTGMDEAIWAVLPEDKVAGLSPQTHMAEVHKILMEEAANQRKSVRMRVWLDHDPVKLPAGIRDQVSVEPWAYDLLQAADIGKKVACCTSRKGGFMMGAGMSALHLQGAYDATRAWCWEGRNSLNAEGADICIWETNDFSSQLPGVFAGADCCWHPRSFKMAANDPFGERERGKIILKMKRWQNLFREALPRLIDADRGPEVYRGQYVLHEKDGNCYVAPTVAMIEAASAEFAG
jgi:hypothetical protein